MRRAPAISRECLPDRRQSETVDLWHGGKRFQLTVGEYNDGRPGEVFIRGTLPQTRRAGRHLANSRENQYNRGNVWKFKGEASVGDTVMADATFAVMIVED